MPDAHRPEFQLHVRALSFAYAGQARRVVDLWSQDFGPGLVWLRGANGTGKSTRLKLLAGALAPQYGSAELQGCDLLRQPLDYRRQVAFVGAEPPPFEHLSPSEYFGFLSGLYPRADAAAWQQHIEGFGLQPFLGQPMRSLSTGTQHKAALATALALGTPLLLLDEPLNALDAASLTHLRGELSRAAQSTDRILLLVSHEELGVVPSARVELSA
ncbi:ATP-binding cassette domain-containing protein [Paucibacter sp. DJ2R-2]|uniref:ABC transporter ATP-binding protein n=1 Tax=Paucibacter sp. DJ2R-2 TaxID=2893558 RepID=UPI0021E3F8AB|nr:ATP-binding cassette domain-containing protein [Paucibacter sp. DJ2R-2]MCV2421379.1 ATP-binding cassette domain-containing protein [Paucibacter sp. DJ4R-1]MCV2441166.1 ATP-binding cassette domain-containing protein [Paucibacter sp. DJ2R-2]